MHISPLSVLEVDALLNEIASRCPWSSHDIRHVFDNQPKRPIRDVLMKLYNDMPPFDAAVLTQILLKDLRPVLYPIAATDTTVSLTSYNASSIQMLTLADALCDWESGSWVYWQYATLQDFGALGSFVEENPVNTYATPQVGTRILVSSCSLVW